MHKAFDSLQSHRMHKAFDSLQSICVGRFRIWGGGGGGARFRMLGRQGFDIGGGAIGGQGGRQIPSRHMTS